MTVSKVIFITILIGLNTACTKIDNELCEQVSEYRITDFDGMFCYTDISDGIKCAKAQKKPIFLLFTGYGVASHSLMIDELFLNRKNRNLIAQNYIPVVLYVDDRKKLRKEFQTTYLFNGKERTVKNIGNKNTQYQIEMFKQNSQALLAVLDENGNQIIKPIGYSNSVARYQVFLEKGLDNYRKIVEE